MDLKQFFTQNNKLALGFSGGVDSSYLLYAAMRHGAEVRAYFVKSEFQPQFELDDANRLARQLDAPLTVLNYPILSEPAVSENTQRRCYHCKSALFGLLRRQAAADGCTVLIDGTNASDEAGDRPGMQALSELRVLSPLRMCGITKQQVRALSREAGLFTWDKPSYACLATRIPTGSPITADALHRVEAAEDALFDLGFSDLRVRVLGDAARLQLPGGQLEAALAKRGEILERLTPFFSEILLDMNARQ